MRQTREGREGFTVAETVRLTGVSEDVLDYWCRTRFVVPSVQHAQRQRVPKLYSFKDLVALRVAATLRARGIAPRDLRRIVTYLRKRSGLSVTDTLARSLLVTDGHDVYEVTYDEDAQGNRTLTSALRAPGQGVFCAVEFSGVVDEIQRGVRALMAATRAA
jgi:DNA-binding transcriptional MerR regulator